MKRPFLIPRITLPIKEQKNYTLKLCNALKQNKDFVAWERRGRLAKHWPELASDRGGAGH